VGAERADTGHCEGEKEGLRRVFLQP
jgi:hypothetical protein